MSPHCDMSDCEHVCNDIDECPGWEEIQVTKEFLELKLEMIGNIIKISETLNIETFVYFRAIGKTNAMKLYKIFTAKTIPELEAVK